MNKATLIGVLGRDPELRKTSTDKSVCTFSIAVKRNFKNQDGEYETDWFNIVVWDKKGDNCAKYLQTGSWVGVSGRIQNRSWDGDDGNKKYITEIIADDVQFLKNIKEVNGESSQDLPY